MLGLARAALQVRAFLTERGRAGLRFVSLPLQLWKLPDPSLELPSATLGLGQLTFQHAYAPSRSRSLQLRRLHSVFELGHLPRGGVEGGLSRRKACRLLLAGCTGRIDSLIRLAELRGMRFERLVTRRVDLFDLSLELSSGRLAFRGLRPRRAEIGVEREDPLAELCAGVARSLAVIEGAVELASQRLLGLGEARQLSAHAGELAALVLERDLQLSRTDATRFELAGCALGRCLRARVGLPFALEVDAHLVRAPSFVGT